jgi:hypothetical protein
MNIVYQWENIFNSAIDGIGSLYKVGESILFALTIRKNFGYL